MAGLPADLLAMLESRLINLHPVWARECLEHIRSETQATMTTLALCDKIQEYFVLTPLRDSAAGPVLPANVEEAHEEVVGSRRPGGQHGCILEIESIIDVGVSAWKFVDHIRLAKEGTKAAVEFRKPGEPDPVQKAIDTLPRSMLKLTLTDGYHSIPAMEYQPLRFLSLKTPLGTKLVVKDATIRRGVLYLTPENVRVLGLGYEETPEVLADRLLQLFGDTVLDRKDSVHLYPANEPAEPAEPAPEFKDDFGGGGEPVRGRGRGRGARGARGTARKPAAARATTRAPRATGTRGRRGRVAAVAEEERQAAPRRGRNRAQSEEPAAPPPPVVAARPHPNPYRPPAIGVQQAAPVEDDEFDFGEDEQELLAALDEAEGRMDNREPYNPEPPPTSRFEARGHLSKPIVKDLKPEILVEDTPAFDLTQPESEVFSLDFGILSKHSRANLDARKEKTPNVGSPSRLHDGIGSVVKTGDAEPTLLQATPLGLFFSADEFGLCLDGAWTYITCLPSLFPDTIILRGFFSSVAFEFASVQVVVEDGTGCFEAELHPQLLKRLKAHFKNNGGALSKWLHSVNALMKFVRDPHGVPLVEELYSASLAFAESLR